MALLPGGSGLDCGGGHSAECEEKGNAAEQVERKGKEMKPHTIGLIRNLRPNNKNRKGFSPPTTSDYYCDARQQHQVIIVIVHVKATIGTENASYITYMTHPALRFDVLHLMVGAFADGLTAPQLDANLKGSVTHGANGQEVGQNGQYKIVTGGVG